MNFLDLFYFIINYDQTLPETFFMWCLQHNFNDIDALINMIENKPMNKIILKYKNIPQINLHSNNCQCDILYTQLNIQKIELQHILKCIPQNINLNTQNLYENCHIRFREIILNREFEIPQTIKTTNIVQNPFENLKFPPNDGNLFDSDNRITIHSFYRAIHHPKFIYDKFAPYLDIIDIFIIERIYCTTLFSFRNLRSLIPIYLQHKKLINSYLNLIKLYQRQFVHLLPYDDVTSCLFTKTIEINTLPKLHLDKYIIQPRYVGYKCTFQCIRGVCYIFDDFARIKKIFTPVITQYFESDDNFLIECVIVHRDDVFKHNKYHDQIFIVTDIFRFNHDIYTNLCYNIRYQKCLDFVQRLQERKIKNFISAGIVSYDKIEEFIQKYYNNIIDVGFDMVKFNGLIFKSDYNNLSYKFTKQIVYAKITNDLLRLTLERTKFPIGKLLQPKFTVYLVAKFFKPNTQLYILTQHGLRPFQFIHGSINNYQTNYHIVQVSFDSFTFDKFNNIILNNIISITVKPTKSIYNVLHEKQLQLYYNLAKNSI